MCDYDKGNMNQPGATSGIPTVAAEGGASRPEREGAVAHHCAMPTGSQNQVIEATEVEGDGGPPTLKLRLKKSGADAGAGNPPKKIIKKQVSWTQETVDNEHLGKKKSKCCCVYVKPKKLGESDTESESGENDDDDCKHCSGHTPSDPTQKGSRS